MAEETVRVDGIPELEAALARFASDTENLAATHDVIARGLLPGVAARTPFRTGLLASSWRGAGTPNTADITSDVEYAAPVEYGVPARGQAAARMVRDAIAASERDIVATYDRELTRMAKGEGWDTA